MATHSSILAWRIPWMEKPGGLQSLTTERLNLCMVSGHLQTMRVLLLFQSGFLLFLFLLWLLWPGLLKPCWIVVVRVAFLVPDFKGNAFSFLPLKMFVVGLLYMAFLMLRYVPSMPAFLRVFIVSGCCIFTGSCCCVRASPSLLSRSSSLLWCLGLSLRWLHCGASAPGHAPFTRCSSRT